MLPHLVALLHEIWALVVMEDIETEDEGMIALASNVDLIQGFLFGMPRPDVVAETPPIMSSLCAQFSDTVHTNAPALNIMQSVGSTFSATIHVLSQGVDRTLDCAQLMNMDRVLRCYLLDDKGTQIGPHYDSLLRTTKNDDRFAPLSDAAGGNWCRRPYFRRALENPGHTQTTRPYFSIPDAGICVTMACTFDFHGTTFVFCCDLEPRDDHCACIDAYSVNSDAIRPPIALRRFEMR